MLLYVCEYLFLWLKVLEDSVSIRIVPFIAKSFFEVVCQWNSYETYPIFHTLTPLFERTILSMTGKFESQLLMLHKANGWLPHPSHSPPFMSLESAELNQWHSTTNCPMHATLMSLSSIQVFMSGYPELWIQGIFLNSEIFLFSARSNVPLPNCSLGNVQPLSNAPSSAHRILV